MKPWPAHLLQKYPLHPDVCEERPWWCFKGDDQTGRWVRNDSMVLPLSSVPEGTRFYRSPHQDGKPISQKEAMAEWDHVKPLPHPGFRSGQVWALEFPQVSIVGVLDNKSPRLGAAYADFVDVDPGVEYDEQEIYVFGGRDISRKVFHDLFEKPLSNDTFLLADPCCPWLAPWSPSKP